MGAHVVNEEAFCLKWNDFHTSLTSTFTELRAESDLLDATIVCEGQALRAHKLVLSASSVVFRQLFRTNGGLAVSTSQSEPVVLMWDVKADDLKSLLNFMYEGEVNVGQDNLNSFLALAERLQVRGLTSNVLANNNRDGGTTRTGQTATRPLIRSSHPHHQAKRPRTDGPGQDQTIIKEELPSVDGEHPTENAIYDNATSTTEPSFNSQYPYYEGSSVEHQHGEDDLRQTGGVVAAGTSGTTGNNFASTVPIGAANHALNADSANHGQEFVTGDVDQAKDTESEEDGDVDLSPYAPGEGVCPFCSKNFKRLRTHVSDIHLPEPQQCLICRKIIPSKIKYQRHKSKCSRTQSLLNNNLGH